MNNNELTSAEEGVIYLASCAVRGVAPDTERIASLDCSELYNVAARHLLTAVTAYALDDAGIEDAAFKQAQARAMRKNVLLGADSAAVLRQLDGLGIWYMPLKGSVLKDLYPRLGMRQMADVDILFDASRGQDVREVMERQGFTTISFGTSHHDRYEKQPVSNFEMHRLLFTDANHDVLYKYYLDVKDRLVKDEGNNCGWHFTNEDFYLYMVAHEYGHYSMLGTGLRSLLDTYVYCTRKGDSMDWDYISREAEKLDIAEFERQNRSLSLHLFGGEPLTDLDWEMLDVVLRSGTYGNRAVRVENRMEEGHRLGYLLTRAFPPMSKMKWDYPVLRMLPVLLPACWVMRLCRTWAKIPGVMLSETREIFRR